MDGVIAIVTVGLVFVLGERALRRRDNVITDQRAAAVALGQRAEEEMARAQDLALEAARLRTEFLSNVGHEILTPLNGIVGMSRLLLDSGLSAQQHEYAEAVRSSSDMLRGIVKDVLDFSYLSDGELVLEEGEFDPHDSMERVAALFVGQAKRAGLKLTLELDERLPKLAVGDSRRLEQILTNLVSNAVRFSERGEVMMRARQRDESANDITLLFEVIDDGIGIAAGHQGRIFQPFAQVDGSASRKYGGSGLGLAISAELVRQMGGKSGWRVSCIEARLSISRFRWASRYTPTNPALFRSPRSPMPAVTTVKRRIRQPRSWSPKTTPLIRNSRRLN